MKLREDYVSFETAKRLKEKGFPQDDTTAFEVWNYYDEDGVMHSYADKIGHKPKLCDAPYLSLVQKWLKEEKDIRIELVSTMDFERCYYSIVIKNPDGSANTVYNSMKDDIAVEDNYAINYAINKIIELGLL